MLQEVDVETAVRAAFESRIKAEIAQIEALGNEAKARRISEAIAELTNIAPPPPKGRTHRGSRTPRQAAAQNDHPARRYWARFTPEQRTEMMRERRRKGLSRKVAASRNDRSFAADTNPDLGRRVVDLFCGAGGSTVGWTDAGFDLVLGVDNCDAALETYRANHPHDALKLDLNQVEQAVKIIEGYRPDIIIGSPPCTDFSLAGRRKEGAAAELTRAFAEIVAKVRPRAFVMENVPQARKSRAYAEARKILKAAGYGLSESVLDASHCGAPQRRLRLFVTGQLGAEDGWLDLPRGHDTVPMTLREAFGDTFPQDHYRHPCNSKSRAIFSADVPSPTIRGVNRPMPRGYVGRGSDTAAPEGLRALTTKERAAIQTFPASYKWRGSKTAIELQIGNAVPPMMAAFVASAILKRTRAYRAEPPMVVDLAPTFSRRFDWVPAPFPEPTGATGDLFRRSLLQVRPWSKQHMIHSMRSNRRVDTRAELRKGWVPTNEVCATRPREPGVSLVSDNE